MSGRRRPGLAPNLFPFLAVLICTLGTLILMLAMVARNAGDLIAAEQTADSRIATEDKESTAEIAARLDREVAAARWHREQTVKMRESQTADLESRRDRLAHLEDHSRRLREELQALSTEVDKTVATDGEGVTQVQQTLDQVLQQIEAENVAIAKLNEELNSATPRIVIVPHKGPNGTDRRPIYIECRKDGIYLRPGDRLIPTEHLEPIVGMPNPLDAVLRTIRYHAMQEYGDTVAPYPLLVVRPDGLPAYAAARAAMHQWDDQYGYELIPADVELAFPDADPSLDSKVSAVIRQSVERRLAMGAGAEFGGGLGGGSRPEGMSPTASSPAAPTPEALAIRGASGAGMLTNNPPLHASGMPSGEGRPGAGPGRSPFGLDTTPSVRPEPPPVLSTSKMTRPGLGSAVAGSDYTDDSVQRSRILSGRGQPASLSGDQDFAPSPSRTSQTGQSSGQGGGRPYAGSSSGDNLSETVSSDTLVGEANSATDSLDRRPGATLGSNTAEAGGAGMSSGRNGDEIAARNQADAIGEATEKPLPPSQADREIRVASKVSNPSPTSAAPGVGGSQLSGAASAGSQGGGSPSVGTSISNFNEPPPVTRVGRDWALPPQSVSGPKTEMIRTIRVECHPDHFVLLPEGKRGAPKKYPFQDGDISSAALQMATDIRKRVEGWGASLANSRWQPVLDVAVYAGAEDRYRQLLGFYHESGLRVQQRGTP